MALPTGDESVPVCRCSRSDVEAATGAARRAIGLSRTNGRLSRPCHRARRPQPENNTAHFGRLADVHVERITEAEALICNSMQGWRGRIHIVIINRRMASEPRGQEGYVA